MIIIFFSLALSHVREICVAKPTVPSPLGPEYRLIHAQLIMRHGARSPIQTLLPLGFRGMWYCDNDDGYSNKISAAPIVHPRRVRKIIDHRIADFPPTCNPGELNVDGQKQNIALGQAYSKYFIDTTGLLPGVLDPSILWVHATNTPRTYDSVLDFMTGLYPPYSMNEFFNIHTGSNSRDYFHPSSSHCKDLKNISKEYEKTPEFKDLLEKTKKDIKPILDYLNITEVSLDKMDDACDFALTMWCNNQRLGPNITDEMVDTCYRFLGNSTYSLYSVNRGVGASPAMREMLRIIDEALSGENGVRLAVISAHDSTVAALLTLLRYSEERLPPYTSHLCAEVYMKDDLEYYIRFSFNGKEILFDSLHNFKNEILPLVTSYCKEFP